MKTNKLMNISIWGAQILLAGMFLMAGGMKTTKSVEELSQMLPWVTDVPLGLVRFIGTMELLGAIGLLLPSLLKIKPILTPIAASWLICIQVLAMIFHLRRGEASTALPINIFISVVALFVVWGRFKKVPIQAK